MYNLYTNPDGSTEQPTISQPGSMSQLTPGGTPGGSLAATPAGSQISSITGQSRPTSPEASSKTQQAIVKTESPQFLFQTGSKTLQSQAVGSFEAELVNEQATQSGSKTQSRFFKGKVSNTRSPSGKRGYNPYRCQRCGCFCFQGKEAKCCDECPINNRGKSPSKSKERGRGSSKGTKASSSKKREKSRSSSRKRGYNPFRCQRCGCFCFQGKEAKCCYECPINNRGKSPTKKKERSRSPSKGTKTTTQKRRAQSPKGNRGYNPFRCQRCGCFCLQGKETKCCSECPINNRGKVSRASSKRGGSKSRSRSAGKQKRPMKSRSPAANKKAVKRGGKSKLTKRGRKGKGKRSKIAKKSEETQEAEIKSKGKKRRTRARKSKIARSRSPRTKTREQSQKPRRKTPSRSRKGKRVTRSRSANKTEQPSVSVKSTSKPRRRKQRRTTSKKGRSSRPKGQSQETGRVRRTRRRARKQRVPKKGKRSAKGTRTASSRPKREVTKSGVVTIGKENKNEIRYSLDESASGTVTMAMSLRSRK